MININVDETDQPLNLHSPFVKYSETCLRWAHLRQKNYLVPKFSMW